MFPENFKGRAKRLDDLDLPKIGRSIGVGEDEIRAVLEVESRGSGYDAQGRPRILFEPHVFYRLLKGAQRASAVAAGLAYARWGAQPYPRDSYPRLHRAMAINRAAALKACSWGLPQLMGENFKAGGFASVEAMVAAFCEDEEAHLEAMVQFIRVSRLDDELRRHDWAGFARGYNGPGYAKNRYDVRLASAFSRWRAKPDVKFSPDLAEAEEAQCAPKPDSFVDRARVRAVQQRLVELGYHMVGRPDGITGPRTAAAIAAFEAENGLAVTGAITDDLVARLENAVPHHPAEARAEGEPESSRIVQGGRETAAAGAGVSLTGALAIASPVLDQVEAAKGVTDRIKALVDPVRDLVSDHWPLMACVAGGWLLWRGLGIVRARIEDHRSGKTA